jgi:hypothetical protein
MKNCSRLAEPVLIVSVRPFELQDGEECNGCQSSEGAGLDRLGLGLGDNRVERVIGSDTSSSGSGGSTVLGSAGGSTVGSASGGSSYDSSGGSSFGGSAGATPFETGGTTFGIGGSSVGTGGCSAVTVVGVSGR